MSTYGSSRARGSTAPLTHTTSTHPIPKAPTVPKLRYPAEKPSWRQMTSASEDVKESSHTVPHSPL